MPRWAVYVIAGLLVVELIRARGRLGRLAGDPTQTGPSEINEPMYVRPPILFPTMNFDSYGHLIYSAVPLLPDLTSVPAGTSIKSSTSLGVY